MGAAWGAVDSQYCISSGDTVRQQEPECFGLGQYLLHNCSKLPTHEYQLLLLPKENEICGGVRVDSDLQAASGRVCCCSGDLGWWSCCPLGGA